MTLPRGCFCRTSNPRRTTNDFTTQTLDSRTSEAPFFTTSHWPYHVVVVLLPVANQLGGDTSAKGGVHSWLKSRLTAVQFTPQPHLWPQGFMSTSLRYFLLLHILFVFHVDQQARAEGSRSAVDDYRLLKSFSEPARAKAAFNNSVQQTGRSPFLLFRIPSHTL